MCLRIHNRAFSTIDGAFGLVLKMTQSEHHMTREIAVPFTTKLLSSPVNGVLWPQSCASTAPYCGSRARKESCVKDGRLGWGEEKSVKDGNKVEQLLLLGKRAAVEKCHKR